MNLAICRWPTPNRRLFDFFWRRLNTQVESRFILITSGDFYPDRIPQLGDEFMQVQPKRTRVWPRLGHRDGMFANHALVLASAMPTGKRVGTSSIRRSVTCKKPKTPAPHRYLISVNALECIRVGNQFVSRCGFSRFNIHGKKSYKPLLTT